MPFLCYHSICDAWNSPLAVTESAFQEQCDKLSQRFDVRSLDSAVESMNRHGRLPRRTTAITFDDGFVDNIEVALPIVRRHNLPIAVFVVAATIDRTFEVNWVDTPPPFRLETLTRDHLEEMVREGVTIGSHSLFHKDLTSLSFEECLEDLTSSKAVLEEAIRGPVRYLAYPRGLWNDTVARAARMAGYANAFALPISPEETGPFSLPRVGIYRNNGPIRFKLKTSSWYQTARTSHIYQAIRG